MRRPLYDETFTRVLCRVAFQVVLLHWRRCPSAYKPYPAKTVYDLAQIYKAHGWPAIGWTLDGCSRWLACGYTMRAWRDDASDQLAMRAFHKRAPRRGK